ncbi:hypothetical protein GOQ29_09455 [Clostridium sp. D2Q-14]|uniref:hypothetical protein n=1 Tax=Anaeromonas gelatinilytica TaxID=2683194 RepID=UPI00193B3EED|nr:hypothetical protein [Anaeromonas gelatinilytica]MBS4535840.1 hypothetical protein [Anaeromonas gelatinilytica]
MQVTVQEVFNLNEGLEDIVHKELPIGVAFKIQRNMREVEKEYKITQDLRSKLINKYKEKDLANGKVKLKKDKLEDFYQELNELLDQTVNINVQKINVNELHSIKVTPKTLGLIHTILFEGDEEQ